MLNAVRRCSGSVGDQLTPQAVYFLCAARQLGRRRFTPAVAVTLGRHPYHALKHLGVVALILKAAEVGHINQSNGVVEQQGFALFYSAALMKEDKFMPVSSLKMLLR